jgi:hypothetical protein
MNEEVTQTEQEAAMMTVIADIVDGSRALIRDWPLLATAEKALRARCLCGAVGVKFGGAATDVRRFRR